MPPPTTADLVFSPQANHNFSQTLSSLKRSTLSIHARLSSILSDAAFAQQVCEAYGRPLIANERCGSWYIDPKRKAGSAYFKSTDGHTGVWKFSLRRLNFHLLNIVGRNDGCIVIDSTRRGKRMPDALSKTIPIWCSILNRLLFPDCPEYHELHTPPQVVSRSEHAQITTLLPTFHASLLSLNLSLDHLKSQVTKPLRPIWITPESSITSTGTIFKDYHPIICCTVSRRVIGAEISEGGYIQGAGDDTENWACGLTPKLFWAHQQILLQKSETELLELMKQLVAGGSAANDEQQMKCIQPTCSLFVSSVSVARGEMDDCTIILLPKVTDQSTWHTSSRQLDVGLGPHKTGSRNLRVALPVIVALISNVLSSGKVDRIVIACESGKDLSVGTSLAILCLFFDDKGNLLQGDDRSSGTQIDKTFIRQRLGWISTSMPDANPSRATLQSVNSFLMERPR